MHLGIIPDGNRRWAREYKATIKQAYAIGFCNVLDLALRVADAGIQELTFFGLSKDNRTKRSRTQLEPIFWQLVDALTVAINLLRDHRIKIKFYGDLEELEDAHREALLDIENATVAQRIELRMNILVNYSVEWDLGGRPSFGTSAIPPCDIVFRSGKARRLSGFLPIQTANSELHFSSLLWPDVQTRHIFSSLARTRSAQRNFGA
jgi:undecaprenyl diphosphate synthase